MDIDAEKLEQTVLALLYCNSFDDKSGGKRAWKGFPWSVMDQLHEKGYISDPATKNKSMWLLEKGAQLLEELFEKLFAANGRRQAHSLRDPGIRSLASTDLPVRHDKPGTMSLRLALSALSGPT
jgi:hypothetical protein